MNLDSFGPRIESKMGKRKYGYLGKDRKTDWKTLVLTSEKASAGVKFLNTRFLKNRDLKAIYSDNAGEFESEDFLKLCIEKGVQIRDSRSKDSKSHGFIENAIKTLQEDIRCILYEANMTAEFWNFAAMWAIYVSNRLGNPSPYEKRFGEKPDLSGIKVFGCKAAILPPLQDTAAKNRIFDRTIHGRFVGVDETRKTFMILTEENEIKPAPTIKVLEEIHTSMGKLPVDVERFDKTNHFSIEELEIVEEIYKVFVDSEEEGLS